MMPAFWKRGLQGSLVIFPLLTTTAFAATITIINNDGPNEGFNDPTPVTPVDGNPGTTLGEQRLNAAQAAADAWGAVLKSDVEIRISMTFDDLYCSSTGATLGQAGPTTVHRDFSNAPLNNTWYVQALANSLAGTDLEPAYADISAQFNSALDSDPTCLGGMSWWYGIDSSAPTGMVDFYPVLLHEIAHGLGFMTLVDTSNGSKFYNYDDAFMIHLEDHSQGMNWPDMTDAGRQASATDTGDLHWTGTNALGNASLLTDGISGGHIKMYAPSTLELGSSVSHWDLSITPDEVMEAYATAEAHDLITFRLMQDIGWNISGPSMGMGVCDGSNVNYSGPDIAASEIVICDLDDGTFSNTTVFGDLTIRASNHVGFMDTFSVAGTLSVQMTSP